MRQLLRVLGAVGATLLIASLAEIFGTIAIVEIVHWYTGRGVGEFTPGFVAVVWLLLGVIPLSLLAGIRLFKLLGGVSIAFLSFLCFLAAGGLYIFWAALL